jgi:hypothetical protein
MFTKDDVHLLWQESKYLKKRGIEPHGHHNQTAMYNEAMRTGKPVIVNVSNLVRYTRQYLKRFEFNLFILRRYFNDEPRTVVDRNDYRIMASNPILALYRPSLEFSSIKIVQPLEEQIIDETQWAHTSPHTISRKPRVTLKPPFGVDYRTRAEDSIPIEHVMTWMPTINTAYEAVAAQFFKDGVLV